MSRRLPDEVVIEIKRLLKHGIYKTSYIIGKFEGHNISRQTIYNIKKKDHYAHLNKYV